MINLQILKNEILNDPENLGYNIHVFTGADSLISEIINFQQFDEIGKLPIEDLQAWMMQNIFSISPLVSVYQKIIDVSNDNNHVAYLAAKQVNHLMNARFKNVDFSLLATNAILNALKDAEIINLDQYNAVISLATSKVSRAEKLFGLGVRVTNDDIAKCLRS